MDFSSIVPTAGTGATAAATANVGAILTLLIPVALVFMFGKRVLGFAKRG